MSMIPFIGFLALPIIKMAVGYPSVRLLTNQSLVLYVRYPNEFYCKKHT